MSPTASSSSNPTDEGQPACPRRSDRALARPSARDARPDCDPRSRRGSAASTSTRVSPSSRSSERFAGPVVDVGSGGGAPGVPIAAALPEREVALLEATRRKCDFLESVAGEFPNVRVVCGRAEEQPIDGSAWRVAKALAPPPVAVEWCLPLVATGGAAILLVGPIGRRGRVGRVSAQLGGGRARAARRDPRGAEARAHAAGLPAPAGCRPQAPARLGDGPSAREERMFGCPGGSTQSRTRRAGSGRPRPRSTSPPASPRPARRRSSSTSTRRRTRPRGSARRRTERPATTCSTARRSSSW